MGGWDGSPGSGQARGHHASCPQVRFSRPESEQARQRRVQSYEFLQKKHAEEPWVHLHYHGLRVSGSQESQGQEELQCGPLFHLSLPSECVWPLVSTPGQGNHIPRSVSSTPVVPSIPGGGMLLLAYMSSMHCGPTHLCSHGQGRRVTAKMT